MGQMTCKEYVSSVISNQTNINELRADYPDGMSIYDIESCGLFNLIIEFDSGRVVEIEGVFEWPFEISDFNENVNTRYEI